MGWLARLLYCYLIRNCRSTFIAWIPSLLVTYWNFVFRFRFIECLLTSSRRVAFSLLNLFPPSSSVSASPSSPPSSSLSFSQYYTRRGGGLPTAAAPGHIEPPLPISGYPHPNHRQEWHLLTCRHLISSYLVGMGAFRVTGVFREVVIPVHNYEK